MKELVARYESELFANVTPFWERHSPDTDFGGFFSCLDRRGSVYDTTKDMWMQWRNVYMFAALYNSRYGQSRWLKLAQDGAEFLLKHGRRAPGRYWRQLDRIGEPIAANPANAADFTCSFAAMACAELYKATGETRWREESLACLKVFDETCQAAEAPDPALPARIVYRQLAHPMFRLNMMLVMDACGVGDFAKRMDGAIAEMKGFTDPETGLQLERAHPGGGLDLLSQDGRFVNPGHSLEGMSFVFQRVRRSKRKADLDWALKTTRRLAEFAIDPLNGGLTYYRDVHDEPVAKYEAPLKVWWGQCESATAFLMAYELSGDAFFLNAFRSIDNFCWTRLKDSDYPEWFAYAAVEGRQVHSYKGSKWKTFFHLPRYLLNCIETGRRIAGTACVALLAGVLSAVGAETRVVDGFAPIGNMYAPFCRTVAADESEWDADIAKMAELGFTCLHGFAEWSQVEREEGKFNFSSVDHLLACCERHGVKAIINVATQNAVGYHTPAWLEKRYSGKGLVDCDGDGTVKGQTHLLPCLDDPEYKRYAVRYLTALARHYAGDARISGWVLWGEPMIWKNDKPICYCEHTLAIFRAWLSRRYGDIAKLNAAWGTDGPVDYASFDEVRPPRGAIARDGGYAAWSDWREFMNAHFADIIAEANALLKANGATQPTINEMFCQLSGAGNCNDIWKLAQSSDVVGMSLFCRPGLEIACSLVSANSVAAHLGKSLFVVEEQGGSRYFNYTPWMPTEDEVLSEAVQAMGMGARGLMYWCWRPRFTDFEAGAFGMCRADGKPLPRAVKAGSLARTFQALGRRLTDAVWRPDVGVFIAKRAYFTDADATTKLCKQSVQGAVRALLDLHVTPTLINGDRLAAGESDTLKALILPFAYIMDPDEAAAIRVFVQKGGTVLADFDCAFKKSDGWAYRELPGGGLREVFGLEKDEIVHLEHPSLLPPGNPYAFAVGDYADVLTPTTAKVEESWAGRPLRTSHAFGKGRAHSLAGPAFANYDRVNGTFALNGLLKGILADAGVTPYVTLPALDQKKLGAVYTSQLVRPDGTRILTFVNPGWESREVVARVPQTERAEVLFPTNATGGESVPTTQSQGSALVLTFTLRPWQSVMLEVH